MSKAGPVSVSAWGVVAPPLQKGQLPQAALQALAPPPQRVVDRLRRGSEAPLQDGEGETDGAGTPVVLQGFGAVELAAHVLGNLLVQVGLGVSQPVGHGIGDAFGNRGRPSNLSRFSFTMRRIRSETSTW